MHRLIASDFDSFRFLSKWSQSPGNGQSQSSQVRCRTRNVRETLRLSGKRSETLYQIIRFVALLLLLPKAGLIADEVTQPVSPLRMAVGQTLQPEDENRLVEVEGPVVFAGAEGRAVYVEIGSEAGSMSVTITEGAGYLT